MRLAASFVFALMLFSMGGAAYAAGPPPTPAPGPAPSDGVDSATYPNPAVRQAVIQAIEMSKLDIADRKLSLAWREAAFRRALGEDQHFMFTLYKQSVLDLVLTILVLIIVFGGLYMSYLQFKADIGDGTGPISTVKISKDGVEISSSVIGLFILLGSMFFFYFYLEKVYEIKYLDTAVQAQSSGATAPK